MEHQVIEAERSSSQRLEMAAGDSPRVPPGEAFRPLIPKQRRRENRKMALDELRVRCGSLKVRSSQGRPDSPFETALRKRSALPVPQMSTELLESITMRLLSKPFARIAPEQHGAGFPLQF